MAGRNSSAKKYPSIEYEREAKKLQLKFKKDKCGEHREYFIQNFTAKYLMPLELWEHKPSARSCYQYYLDLIKIGVYHFYHPEYVNRKWSEVS